MKNWKVWQKNLIAAAVLVVVCAGIYMNWMYTNDKETADLTDTLDAQKVLSEDGLILSGDTAAGSNANNTLTDYFAAVRLSRQQARDSAVELLQEAMAYGSGEETSQSSAQLEQIIQMALTEAQIESLVVAKGYADCVAYITDDGISLAVAMPEEGLTQSDVSLLADIVMSQTDFKLSDIRVIGVE